MKQEKGLCIQAFFDIIKREGMRLVVENPKFFDEYVLSNFPVKWSMIVMGLRDFGNQCVHFGGAAYILCF